MTGPRNRGRVVVAWVAADLVSILGSRLAAIAVPWLVLTTTGSATRTGLVAAAELFPMVLSRALSGPLIDRVGTVRSALVADVVSAVAMAGVPLLWTAHLLSWPALTVLVAVLGAARGPGDSAKQTMLPDIAAVTGQPLERITGMGSTTERLASTVGVAVGGVVVALVGGADALVVTAAGFAVSSTLVLVVLRPALAGNEPAGWRGAHYLTELGHGVRALRRDPVLVGIVVMLAISNGIDQAFMGVMMPSWVLRNGYGPGTLGWLFATFMVAAVVGALLATAFSRRLPRLPVYVGGFLVAGAPRFAVLAFDVPLPGVLAVLAVSGFGAGFLNPILGAVTLERAPLATRGRVMALIGAASIALMPVGGLAGGVLVDGVGLTSTLLLAGTAYFVVTLLPVILPSWRGFGQRPGSQPQPTDSSRHPVPQEARQ